MRLNAKTLGGPKPRKNQIANLVLDSSSGFVQVPSHSRVTGLFHQIIAIDVPTPQNTVQC
ncbi:hypothetical protein BS47DRAFT_1337558 [Hydnum rufescens UP504]|uniref:Uncharacterized protein n=1 Tax=Hydnum rufescens UP504 TaxID=1448309 RepID=A0A9P6E177_9AGAM|nr:hypothetical protein BS47DRAFT_1337558 [Hydnum rufescens UP504]